MNARQGKSRCLRKAAAFLEKSVEEDAEWLRQDQGTTVLTPAAHEKMKRAALGLAGQLRENATRLDAPPRKRAA